MEAGVGSRDKSKKTWPTTKSCRQTPRKLRRGPTSGAHCKARVLAGAHTHRVQLIPLSCARGGGCDLLGRAVLEDTVVRLAARLDVELDALVLAKAVGVAGGSGGGSVLSSLGHGDGVVLCWVVLRVVSGGE